MSFRDAAPRRHFVWLIVILAHAGLICALLLSRPPLFRDRMMPAGIQSFLLLPSKSASLDAPRVAIHLKSEKLVPRVITVPMPPSIPIDAAITLSPTELQQQRIDWDHETALAVQASIAETAKENNYRDLSTLTPDELDWVKKNHLEPIPGFKWDRNSRRELLRHGIVKLNDYCVLIVVMPFCRFGAKIQYNGDLFEHMRDPTPLER